MAVRKGGVCIGWEILTNGVRRFRQASSHPSRCMVLESRESVTAAATERCNREDISGRKFGFTFAKSSSKSSIFRLECIHFELQLAIVIVG
jgi:hypothetical protein